MWFVRWPAIIVRADSGFYTEKVVTACQAHGARFSLSVRLQKSHHQLIAAIPEEEWKPIPYWLEGAADVAEIPYRPFGKKQTYRMIVRRVAPTPGTQLWLKGVAYSHYAFITDRESEMLELEADHRQHAVVENVIRDSKYGLGLNHMPSGKFGANAAWLATLSEAVSGSGRHGRGVAHGHRDRARLGSSQIAVHDSGSSRRQPSSRTNGATIGRRGGGWTRACPSAGRWARWASSAGR